MGGGTGRRDRGGTETNRGHRQGAREQRGSRQEGHPKKKKRQPKHQRMTNRGSRATHEGGEAGSQQRRKGTLCLAQKNAMPMTRIEPYRPSRPTIRELMGGEAGGGARRGSPPEGVSAEAARVGLQVGGQGRGPEERERTRDKAIARGRSAESTRSSRTTVRRRADDRREGRGERGEVRETRGRGAHLAWPGTAKGHAAGGRWDRRRAPRGAVTR